jgi:hypothetical protein
VNFIRIQGDEEDEVQYVHMEDPSAVEITFVRAPCPKKEVLYIGCSNLGMFLHIFSHNRLWLLKVDKMLS